MRGMIALIRKQLDTRKSDEENIQKVREFLQLLILKILFDIGAFKFFAFVGGTALRILYDLKRFSEDLDFSLIYKEHYDFELICERLKRSLADYGFQAEGHPKGEKTVQGMMLKFGALLKKLGLSPLDSQKLFIRLEVDSNPPAGAHTVISLNNRVFTFTITHHDLPSLFATKLHACFFRSYTKGRDFYDLYWYLGRGVRPNFALLNSAILQSQKEDPKMDESTFPAFVVRNLEKVDFAVVKKDLEKFLEDKSELDFINKEMLISLLR